MISKRKEQICALLKGIETGDAAAVAVVNPDKYIQHNPETHEGSEGLAALFKRISQSSPRVNIVRVFEDGDYVFAHTEYDFANLMHWNTTLMKRATPSIIRVSLMVCRHCARRWPNPPPTTASR